MSGVGIFFLILFLLLIIGGVSWIAYTRIRAQRLGLPPPPLNPFASRSSTRSAAVPAPAPSGVVGWFSDKFSALKSRKGSDKNARYASGAYESTHNAPGGNTARRHTLDPDEAWDARVGNEADYGYGYDEEQELGGIHSTPYNNSTNAAPGAGGYVGASLYSAPPERGRSRSRDLDERYDEEMGGGGRAGYQSQTQQHHSDPFGDHAERSDLRGVSPRPVEQHGGSKAGGATGNSPTESRRSLFREEM